MSDLSVFIYLKECQKEPAAAAALDRACFVSTTVNDAKEVNLKLEIGSLGLI